MLQKPVRNDAGRGILYGLAAYGWWGFAVIFFKYLVHVPALELLAHRIVWALPLLVVLLLTLGRIGSVPLSDFCDSALRDLLGSIGGEWESGRLRVGDEHMTTEVVTGVLHALRREWLDSQPDRSPATGGQSIAPPVAVVGTLEGNRHGIGALSTRMILERRGWRVYYPGVDVPVEDFGFVQMSRDASLVCISLPPNATLGDVTRTLSILSKYYDQARPYSVVFGGLASVNLEGEIQEGPFESVAFFPTVGSLEVALSGGLGAADTRRPLTAVGAA